MDHYAKFYREATQEQIDRFHEYRCKAAMANRILSEPAIYRPDPNVCGFIFAGSFQCGQFISYEAQLFKARNYNSMRGIINGERHHIPMGWHGWGTDMAKAMPGIILNY